MLEFYEYALLSFLLILYILFVSVFGSKYDVNDFLKIFFEKTTLMLSVITKVFFNIIIE